MNNFRKHCAFYVITFAPWRSPPPPGNYKTMGFVFLHVKCPVSRFGGLVFLLETILSMWGGGGGFSLCGEILMLISTCKIFYGALALDAKVVANI